MVMMMMMMIMKEMTTTITQEAPVCPMPCDGPFTYRMITIPPYIYDAQMQMLQKFNNQFLWQDKTIFIYNL